MRFGFVLDQNKCIGCHACTVACKEENGVALGVFRTWVKYVEKGTFPDTRRHFAVLRCNHCDDAPCVTICPTSALFRRQNGIVDFDKDACIGCKACMQACPYDAIHIDPATDTAAKCHFCAHRVDRGLEPACVIVCPEQAIVTGDLDDPASNISKLISRNDVRVRKPEQGTKPKVFYLGADEATLTPGAATAGEHQMMATATAAEAEHARLQPENPLEMARVAYDPSRNREPWGWKVAAYLWTKSVAAGAMMIAATDVLLKGYLPGRLLGPAAAGLAVVFTMLTALLLVLDLKKPSRFIYILIRPNFRSWLVWGTFALIFFSLVSAVWFVVGREAALTKDARILAGHLGTLRLLAGPALFGAVAAACYSAFLFGQAEGRDFWQSPLLFFQLLFAAVLAGSASLILTAVAIKVSPFYIEMLRHVLTGALVAEGLVVLAETCVRHASQDARLAARMLTTGVWKVPFWGGVVVGGIVFPLVFLLMIPGDKSAMLASVLALMGLALYEHLWVRAGQAPPLS